MLLTAIWASPWPSISLPAWLPDSSWPSLILLTASFSSSIISTSHACPVLALETLDHGDEVLHGANTVHVDLTGLLHDVLGVLDDVEVEAFSVLDLGDLLSLRQYYVPELVETPAVLGLPKEALSNLRG